MQAPGKTVVLIPTYNERENIAYMVAGISASLPEASIIVLDDNSPDGTGEEVRTLQKTYPQVVLRSRPGKQGLGRAYLDGFRAVLAEPQVERVIMMDADGSHAPEYLPALIAASADADLVVGSRYVRGGGIENWEPWRYLLSRYGNFYARMVTGLPLRDLTAGFMCLRVSLLRSLDLNRLGASGYAFLMELKFCAVHKGHASVAEVPIIFKVRRGGESKISSHIIREGLLAPWKLRFKK